MKPDEISRTRLLGQQISETHLRTPKEVVAYMGAMQAQDYPMSKWAVGVRLDGATDKSVEAAIDKGQIIRTHALRPTWHLVSADDIYWMLELSAPQIEKAARARHKELELTSAVFSKSRRILEKALGGGKSLGRPELMKHFTAAKIAVNENRSSHLLMQAEIEGLICSGKDGNGKHTYALLEERVPKKKLLKREEAAAELAKRYFSSHFPATTADFAWWSGLPAKEARAAVEALGKKFIREKIGEQTYWMPSDFAKPKMKTSSVYLLPAYDEYIISYKDRTAVLDDSKKSKAISANGLFWPTVIVDGRVSGLWKRTVKNETVIIETKFFHPHEKAELKLMRGSAERFAEFLEKKMDLRP